MYIADQDHGKVKLNALKTRNLSVHSIRHSGVLLAGIQFLENQYFLDTGFRRYDELATDFAVALGKWEKSIDKTIQTV